MTRATCLFCHVNTVPIERWNMRCEECREKQKRADEEEQKRIAIHQRMPASVIQPDGTEHTEIFVDKFGKEVPNPGYDLKNDHFGWRFTGKQGNKGAFIK